MKRTAILGAALAAGLLTGGAAQAAAIPAQLDIDFRTLFNNSANFQPSVYNPVRDITVSAWPGKPGLHWDGTDGFGVKGGEPDEINGRESIGVKFGTNQALKGVWLSDIFAAPDGGADGEEATVKLFDEASNLIAEFHFTGEEMGNANNGGLFGSFGGVILGVHRVVLLSVWEKNDEYSVVGFTTVPEPGTTAMLGAGLLGLGWLARRRRHQV